MSTTFPLHSYYIIYLKAMASFRVESQLAILGIHMEDFLLFESLLQNELEIGSSTSFWMVRRSGRAPYSTSVP